jgi:von Willebrand factor type A domain
MSLAAMIWFSSPEIGIVALAAALTGIGIAIVRRIDMRGTAAVLVGVGILLLALAAGGPMWNRPRPGTIAVMVDLSPSTRGAKFRDADFLRQRIGELIGNSPHRLIAFAEENRALDLSRPLPEMPAERTRFSPADVNAIVLFSDARFDLPAASPPVYVVADEGLENAADASVQRLEVRGQMLSATISNSGGERVATFDGTSGAAAKIGMGNIVIARKIVGGATAAGVKLNSGDLWPENDSLSLRIVAAPGSEKWWVGENPPGGVWKFLSPGKLSAIPRDYLAPAVIVVDDEAADQFARPQMDCLMQYVRDLGGSLLIVGGDRAFGAGHYQGTALEQLSPLASSPPKPTTRWIVLVDASGSMSQDTGGGVSRWQRATAAAIHLLPELPPADPIQIGQFSGEVRWWLSAPAAQAAATPLPPADASPHGPTNLESALEQIAQETEGAVPTELLVLSDCDAAIDHPKELGQRFAREKITLNVLAIGRGTGLETVRGICAATGGQVVESLDPRQWAKSIAELSQTALPPRIVHRPVSVTFESDVKTLGRQTAGVWNRTWLKSGATEWAATTDDEMQAPMAACWQVGSGRVAAAAWDLDQADVGRLAGRIAETPRDPRFSVRWDSGGRIHVMVDASDAGKFLNGLAIVLEVVGDAGTRRAAVEQTGPARYETTIDAPADPRLAMLRIGDETIDRTLLPGRYPKEFDAVGNDHAAMRKLAEMSGGAVIWPTDRGPIGFRWATREMKLARWVCAAALVLIAGGLVRARL